MNGNQQTAVEIDFREILHIIKKNWTLILAAALTGVFCAAVLVIVVEKPQYRAQAMLFVDAQSQTDVITNDAMSGAASYADACALVITSDNVMDQTIQALGLNMTRSQLRGIVNASTQNSTQVISITATCEDPKLALSIVSEITQIIPVVMRDASYSGTVKVVSPAALGEGPVAPKKLRGIATGAAVGILLSVVWVLFYSLVLNVVCMTESELKSAGLKLIGVLPCSGARMKKTLNEHESYRIIRTSIESINQNNTHFAFVMAGVGSGKSSILDEAKKLAQSYVDIGSRVLLVNTELRADGPKENADEPKENADGSKENADGSKEDTDISSKTDLRTVLDDDGSIAQAIQYDYAGGIDYINACGSDPDSFDYLGSAKMEKLIQKLGEEYECIVFVSNSASVFADAAILGQKTNGVILMVRQEKDTMNNVKIAAFNLKNSGVKILGVIYTDVHMPV